MDPLGSHSGRPGPPPAGPTMEQREEERNKNKETELKERRKRKLKLSGGRNERKCFRAQDGMHLIQKKGNDSLTKCLTHKGAKMLDENIRKTSDQTGNRD